MAISVDLGEYAKCRLNDGHPQLSFRTACRRHIKSTASAGSDMMPSVPDYFYNLFFCKCYLFNQIPREMMMDIADLEPQLLSMPDDDTNADFEQKQTTDDEQTIKLTGGVRGSLGTCLTREPCVVSLRGRYVRSSLDTSREMFIYWNDNSLE